MNSRDHNPVLLSRDSPLFFDGGSFNKKMINNSLFTIFLHFYIFF
nr:MAG TPA: hypothetical protein [Caudoviricetes sp.]